jgi:hypothetical protein
VVEDDAVDDLAGEGVAAQDFRGADHGSWDVTVRAVMGRAGLIR